MGDPVIGVHIPGGGGLTPEIVDESFKEAERYVKTYFPDYKYKGYTCQSWVCDPQLKSLISEDSNIIKFARRFKPLTIRNDGTAVFSFVFKKMDNNFKIEDLPETTSLERALKNHYLSGKAIYSHEGYILL